LTKKTFDAKEAYPFALPQTFRGLEIGVIGTMAAIIANLRHRMLQSFALPNKTPSRDWQLV